MLRTLPVQIALAIKSRRGRRNLRVLLRFLLALAVMVTTYSAIFHFIMEMEGREHSFISGFYWTLTTMSTLGFGDITFTSDLGRFFSMVVLLSGTIFLLIMLPFTFIEFFYEPWLKAQAAKRAPHQLPPDLHDHVLLTNYDAIAMALIRRLDHYRYPYAVLVPEVEDALRLYDLDVNVVVGYFDDPQAWENARVRSAAIVASTGNDVTNTNVAFTVRGLSENIPVITTASEENAVDILKLAGSSDVLRLEETIGQSFSRRTLGGDAVAHVIGEFDDLLIAEATAHGTPLVGKSLAENQIRAKVGPTVVGVWERGSFEPATPDIVIHDHTVLVLAGSKEHFARYNEVFCIYNVSAAPIVILGGGRVGRATARALAARELDYRIVEVDPTRIRDPEKYILGSAADLSVLERAGIQESSTVVITTHEDDLNVYLTIACRKLRPDIQILARATNEMNVAPLHRAGADSVLSYASMGASAIMDRLQRSEILMVAEGLDLFKVPVPATLAGETIANSSVREKTGCSVVAIRNSSGMEVAPNPSTVIPANADIVLIGSAESEQKFFDLYGKHDSR